MKIVCCANMPLVTEAFSTLGETLVKDGRTITVDDVKDADILAIRSTTKVGAPLLSGSRVRFVGTATIGTDHMDIPWLEKQGISWCFAPGCNANSVSEYITAALLCLGNRHGIRIEGKTIGVIGVGNVGKLVVEKARALGMRVLMNDPPRERAESGSGKSEFVPLDRILAESDVITFHVPLNKSGPDATLGIAGRKFFGMIKPGAIFINAARGPVVVTDELLSAMDAGRVSRCIMDTWEGEPVYRRDLLERADVATPHIAGHSFEGKVMGTVMVYRAACRFLGRTPDWSHDSLMPEPLVPEIEVQARGRADEEVLWDIVRRVYDIEADDARMWQGSQLEDKPRAAHFDKMRKNYPMRREFRFTRVNAVGASAALMEKIRLLGFK